MRGGGAATHCAADTGGPQPERSLREETINSLGVMDDDSFISAGEEDEVVGGGGGGGGGGGSDHSQRYRDRRDRDREEVHTFLSPLKRDVDTFVAWAYTRQLFSST